MLAWLTEPSKCTTILLLSYTLFFYFFFSFKKCYHFFANVYFSQSCNWCGVNGDKKCDNTANSPKEFVVIKSLEQAEVQDQQTSQPQSEAAYKLCNCCNFVSVHKTHKKQVNTQAFCLLLFLGLVFLSIIIMAIAIIILLPLSSENLVTYIFNIFQVTIVMLTTQVGYKLYFSSSFSMKQVFQKFRETFATKKSKDTNETLVAIAKNHLEHPDIDVATGVFAAEFADLVIKKLSGKNSTAM